MNIKIIQIWKNILKIKLKNVKITKKFFQIKILLKMFIELKNLIKYMKYIKKVFLK